MSNDRRQTPGHARRARSAIIVLVLSSGVFLTSAWLLASDLPLVMDEVDYVQAMMNWGTLGLPIFRHGYVDPTRHNPHAVREREIVLAGRRFRVFRDPDQRWGETPSNLATFLVRDDGQVFSYALWHPPLYLWIGQWLPLQGDETASAARYMNVLFVWAAFVVVLWRVGRLYPRRWSVVAAGAVVILVSTPVMLGASLIDVHSGLGPLTVIIWIVLAGASPLPSWPRVLGAAVSLAAVFANCLSLGTGCLAAFVIWRGFGALAGVRNTGALLKDSCVLIGGVAVFAVGYLFTCQLLDLPASYAFLHSARKAVAIEPVETVRLLADYLVALNPAFVLLAMAAAARTWRGGRKQAARHPLGLAAMTVASCVVMYALAGAQAYGFDKYIIPASMLMGLLVAGATAHAATSRRPRITKSVLLLLVLGSIWGAVALVCEVVREDRHPYRSDTASMRSVAEFMRRQGISDREPLICDKDIAFLLDRPFYEAFGGPVVDPDAVPALRRAEQFWLILGPQWWSKLSPLAITAREQYERVHAVGKYEVYRCTPQR